MELSIIIPTKDRGSILQKTLAQAYKAIETINAEIIVVNDSKINAVELDPLYRNKVKVISNPKSGVASARNTGAAQAQSNLLLFLDDDMLIFPENIEATLQLHQQYKNCCINLNWIYPPSLTDQIRTTQFGRYLIQHGFTSLKGWNHGEPWDDTQLFAVNGITSQYLSMAKTDFFRTGGYNEKFPHAGFEDYEFAQRLKKTGISFYIYPLSMVFHNEEDRLQVKAWLQRKKRGGETRQVAVQMGYTQVSIYYGVWKYSILLILVNMQALLRGILSLIPNNTSLDIIYFRVVNILLATAIFDGYLSKK